MGKYDLMRLLKTNKLLLNDSIQHITAGNIKDKINFANASTHYQLSAIFNIRIIAKMTSDYIQRCFTKIAETENFLQLDVVFLNKILSSSQLSVSSELDVFRAVNQWLECGGSDRHRFAKDLFLKVRFPLLPDRVLRNLSIKSFVLCDFSFFHKHEDGRLLLN